MRLTAEELRASVSAVSEFVAAAYVRFDPPFDTESVHARFLGLPGVPPAVADRLAAAYRAVSNGSGDGAKAAVLTACRAAAFACEFGSRPGEDVSGAVLRAAGRAAEAVDARRVLLRRPAEVERVALTAAGGDAALGAAILEAIATAGKDGVIDLAPGEANAPAEVAVQPGEDTGPLGRRVGVVVRGDSTAATAARYLRGHAALHSAVAAVARGVVPGGGSGYVLAAESIPRDTDAGALALAAGLEAPFRVRAVAAAVNADDLLSAVRIDQSLAFDQTTPGLVPSDETGPLDAVRIVQAAIREAGNTAADLLQLLR